MCYTNPPRFSEIEGFNDTQVLACFRDLEKHFTERSVIMETRIGHKCGTVSYRWGEFRPSVRLSSGDTQAVTLRVPGMELR
jgi:hypothetical protein